MKGELSDVRLNREFREWKLQSCQTRELKYQTAVVNKTEIKVAGRVSLIVMVSSILSFKKRDALVHNIGHGTFGYQTAYVIIWNKISYNSLHIISRQWICIRD